MHITKDPYNVVRVSLELSNSAYVSVMEQVGWPGGMWDLGGREMGTEGGEGGCRVLRLRRCTSFTSC